MPVTSTWNEREVPILEAVYAIEEQGNGAQSRGLAEITGLELGVAMRAVAALVESQHLAGSDVPSMADRFPDYINLRLLERGRRAIGQWPPGPGDAFLVALNRLIAAETDPDERSRLTRLRDAAVDVGKQVLAGAVVAAGTAGLS